MVGGAGVDGAVAIEMAVEITGGTEEPVLELAFEANGIGALEMAIAFGIERGIEVVENVGEEDVGAGVVEAVILAAKGILEVEAGDVVVEIELDDVGVLLDARAGGESVAAPEGDVAPFERGFLAVTI